MPTKFQRITNGMRAAVCGLMLAGVKYETSCRIVDAPEKSMKRLMPPGWFGYRRAAYRWGGQELQDLKDAYDDWSLKVETISQLFNIAPNDIRKLRRLHGWQVRPFCMHRRNPKAVSNMPPQARRLYAKLQRIAGKDFALREVLRHG